jgi:hypothetical protein
MVAHAQAVPSGMIDLRTVRVAAEEDSDRSSMVLDLMKSGLTPEDLHSRELDATERAACRVPALVDGYVIPYQSIEGKALPFYRLRLFEFDPKYKQTPRTPNHLYFPRGWLSHYNSAIPPKNRLSKFGNGRVILWTEGEKKATIATKLGFPCVAATGVDSWRNKVIVMPKDTEFFTYSYDDKMVAAKLPEGYTEGVSTVANGFDPLVDLCLRDQTTIFIVYDSDHLGGPKMEVQRAAATLGYELRARGIQLPQIRQLILPPIPELDKVGLDDYLLNAFGGPDKFEALIAKNLRSPSAFPRHPNISEHVSKKLQAFKLPRREMQNLSLAVLSELDARGRRMYSDTEQQFYYFESGSARLMRVELNTAQKEKIQETFFGRMLYREYGISSSADARLIQWLGTQFSGEHPVVPVTPNRVIARPKPREDVLRIQANDSQFFEVGRSPSGDPLDGIQVLENGVDGVLFEAGSVAHIDPNEVLTKIRFQHEQHIKGNPLRNEWYNVLKRVRLKDFGKPARLASLLYYVSPWLFRWRGTQLPVELVIGESGSGKSTLCELRLEVLTGTPKLRNAPTDLKDWYASIANTGGLHVADNIVLSDKALRQRLSDEICRLITEPNPQIEMRRYYTNAELMQIRVDSVFVFTAIQQPFSNADLLQRAFILELDKSTTPLIPTGGEGDVTHQNVIYDASWKNAQLQRLGGREGWLAHQLLVLQKFLQILPKVWDPTYKAKHRLINLEQILVILARDVFEIDWEWIPSYLANAVEDAVVESDWMMEGLTNFAKGFLQNAAKKKTTQIAAGKKPTPTDDTITVNQISEWCMDRDEYKENQTLTNARRLGRYMQIHKHLIATTAGIYEDGKTGNRIRYRVVPTQANQ